MWGRCGASLSLQPHVPNPKGKNLGKAVQTPMLSWTELLPPPPSASELSQYVEEEEVKKEEEEEEEVVEEEDEEGR